MCLNALFTLLMRTSEDNDKKTHGVVQMIIFLVLDLARMACNLLIVYFGHQMPDNEISDTFYKNLSQTNRSERTDSFSTILDPEEDLDDSENYFICKIEKKQAFHQKGYFFHEFSVIFKPAIYHQYQSRYQSRSLLLVQNQSDSRKIQEDNLKNLNQKKLTSPAEISIDQSFDLLNFRKKSQRYSDFQKLVTKQLQKRPEEIFDFVHKLKELGNPEVKEIEFFNDINDEDVNLDVLETFLNYFMNQTYKTSVQLRQGSPTLESIKSFLDLDYDCEIPNLIDGFSLHMEFPLIFFPEKSFFKKIFTRFLITEISILEATRQVRLSVLDRVNNKVYTTTRKVEEIISLLRSVHRDYKSLDLSYLSSEKKRQQLVYLLHMILNEIRDSSKLSKFLEEQISLQPELSYHLPDFELQIIQKGSYHLGFTIKEQGRSTTMSEEDSILKESALFEIRVEFRGSSEFKMIKRSQEHFEVLANHLVSKFGDNRYAVKKSWFKEVGSLKQYLICLMQDKKVWGSIEFQMFMKVLKSDFDN